MTESTARLIARAGAATGTDDRAQSVRELVTALEVRAARARPALPSWRTCARGARPREGGAAGLNGPTVTEVMNGGTIVAVHAVVPAQGIYRTIAELRAVGAEGILVTRIERLVP